MNDTINEEKIIELLNNNELSKLIDKRYNRDYNGILYLEKTESFIINNLNNKKYINIIKRYTSLIYDKFKENNYIILDSKIFNNEKINRFFNKKQLKEINKFRKELLLDYKNYINKIKPHIEIDEYHLRYIISLIGKDIILTDKTYKYLINNKKWNQSRLANEFIVKYTSYLSSKDLKVSHDNVYSTNINFTDYDKNKKSDRPLCCYGTTLFKHGYVMVRRDIENDDLSKYIKVISHEMKHRKQFDDYKNGRMNKQSLYYILYIIIGDILEKNEKEVIYNNYDYDETEIDANIYGLNFSYNIFSKYSDYKKSLKQIRKDLMDKLLDIKTNSKYYANAYHPYEDITYNVQLLDHLLYKYPFYINYFDILGYIYYDNGVRKGFNSLVRNEKELISKNNDKSKDIQELFRVFYQSDISNDIDINIDGLNSNQKKQIIKKLLDLVINEFKDIRGIVNLCEKHEAYDPSKVKFKIKCILKRINRILNILNENKDEIIKLNDELINLKLEKVRYILDNMYIKIDGNIFNNIYYSRNIHDIQQTGYKLLKMVK